MNSARGLTIVILLTIAGSLLLTEARYHGEDSVPAKYRHKHHREDLFSSGHRKSNDIRLAMKKYYSDDADDDDDDYGDGYDSYEDKQRDEEDYDVEEDDDYEDGEFDYAEGYHLSRYNSRYEEDKRRNPRFGSTLRAGRVRQEQRHQITDYPITHSDYSADPNEIKDKKLDAPMRQLTRLHYRKYNQQQQQRFRHNHYHKANELHTPRWRNSWYNDKRIDNKNIKGWKWRKSKYKQVYSGISNKTRGDERKWRSHQDNDYFNKKYSIDDDDEEEDIWSEVGDYGDTNEDDDFDGINYDYFYDVNGESIEKPPYKTYDEIIKRLTSDEPITKTPYSNFKRDYRNTGADIEKFLKFDDYGNLKLDSNNLTVSNESMRINDKLIMSDDTSKEFKTADDEKLNNVKDKNQSKTKSLNHDYVDDWGNNDNVNKKEEVDGGEDGEEEYDIDVRNDTVTNVYMDNQNETENETSAPVPSTTSTTTIRSTTRESRTTASRPVIIITTQKTNDHRKNITSITQSLSTNGLQSIRTGQRLQTKAQPHQQHPNEKNAEMREALHHALQVSREGSCRWPRARVIPVRDVYPSQGTNYIPHCAILHRCSDDTGCCRSEQLTCVPKHSHRVELYFYANSIGGGTEVKKLSFYNDTECICRERRDRSLSNEKRSTLHHHHQHQVTSPPENMRIPPQKKPCRCPSEFTPRITPEGECQCKCFENDDECVKARRGKVYFSARDRVCIQKEECAMPRCEFGEYMIRQGKCPKKKDKIESIANYPSKNYHHHRPRS